MKSYVECGALWFLKPLNTLCSVYFTESLRVRQGRASPGPSVCSWGSQRFRGFPYSNGGCTRRALDTEVGSVLPHCFAFRGVSVTECYQVTFFLQVGWLKPSIICYDLSINIIKSLGLSVKPACVSQKKKKKLNVKVFPETCFNERERWRKTSSFFAWWLGSRMCRPAVWI